MTRNDIKQIKSMIAEIEYGYIGHGNLHSDNDHGLNLIKEQLEKAVPMLPEVEDTNAWISRIYYCPNCKKKLVKEFNCSRCRQAIDWIEQRELETPPERPMEPISYIRR